MADLTPSLVEFKQVTFAYPGAKGDRVILKDLSLSVPRGKVTALMGASGGGKTTVLRLIGGQQKASTGNVLFDGQDVGAMAQTALYAARRRMGMLFQFGALFTDMSVFDNVAFPLREHRKSWPARRIREKVMDILKLLGLEGKENRMPSELSGGQRKRVGLARALMLEPQILIYDEPTSGLDPITSRMVDDLIEETRDRFNVTSVVISHDMTSTFRIAHTAYLLVQGLVIASGKPDELAYGSVEAARAFIAASGVDPKQISRVDGAHDESATIKYKAM